MKVKELFEMTNDQAEANAHNMYGSLSHPKAQSYLSRNGEAGGGSGGGSDDGYSWKEWAHDWFEDHFGGTDSPAMSDLKNINGRNPEAAFAEIDKADPSLEDQQIEYLMNYLYDL
jgi:hypothetical protein